jgi:hypothetical protein
VEDLLKYSVQPKWNGSSGVGWQHSQWNQKGRRVIFLSNAVEVNQDALNAIRLKLYTARQCAYGKYKETKTRPGLRIIESQKYIAPTQ